jgi:hypothetical protein
MEACPKCNERKGEYQGEDIEEDESVFGCFIEYTERYFCLACGHEWEERQMVSVPGDDMYMW